ncbi:uncharacterized protein EV420DRAFT_1651823 [Desarmillaria tabescens]|uniref:Uncharacterized protein n=1 Tax=Armillaria tabescens TaxID=1929756 RepID=A0AA39MKY5_ARMTA|nr:uncharacterized protein EV420DRAFT_1651823 [Desarmillaria tabescens]KAK0437718.1 hypothetical protein EV420DRAFT_1651823 [Desarmillaria tabescens]
MSAPGLEEINFRSTAVSNIINYGTLCTYDPHRHTIIAAPYPATKNKKGVLLPVPVRKLNGHMKLHTNIQLGSCICGPRQGRPEEYVLLQVIRCGAGSLPRNVGKYALVCPNGKHDGCGWWVPLFKIFSNGPPNFLMHSVGVSCWPLALDPLDHYVLTDGSAMSLVPGLDQDWSDAGDDDDDALSALSSLPPSQNPSPNSTSQRQSPPDSKRHTSLQTHPLASTQTQTQTHASPSIPPIATHTPSPLARQSQNSRGQGSPTFHGPTISASALYSSPAQPNVRNSPLYLDEATSSQAKDELLPSTPAYSQNPDSNYSVLVC